MTRSDKLALMAAIIASGERGILATAVNEAEALLREVESRQPQPATVVSPGQTVVGYVTPANEAEYSRGYNAALDEAIAVCNRGADEVNTTAMRFALQQAAIRIEALKSQPSKEAI